MMKYVDTDPLDELRAVRRRIQRRYKTVEAYAEHLKTVPSAKELLLELAKKKSKKKAAAKKKTDRR